MKLLDVKTWSERQQVLAIILMAGVAIFALWFFLLLPQTREGKKLAAQITATENELVRQSFLSDETTLGNIKAKEDKHTGALLSQWSDVANRLGTFSNQQDLVAAAVDRIDFKVALLNVRQRLLRKARSEKIGLPRDLGMAEFVGSSEDARKLLLQLRSVEKLVDLSLDLNISRVRNLEPQQPIRHSAEIAGGDFLEEYPVRIEYQGSLDSLYDLLHATLQSPNAFMLKGLRIESMEQGGGVVKVNLILSALLFLKDPGKISLPAMTTTTKRTGPLGH
jgi:hypothetical protein